MPRRSRTKGSATRTRPRTRERRAVNLALTLVRHNHSTVGSRVRRQLEHVLTKVPHDNEPDMLDDEWGHEYGTDYFLSPDVDGVYDFTS